MLEKSPTLIRMANDDAEFIHQVLNLNASNETRGVEIAVLREALSRVLTPETSADMEQWIADRIRQRMNARLAEIADDEPDMASLLKKMIESV